jgi:NAD(P)-dependent dehydrogenase (short-subunit alcohol dehydrogenase family)
MTIRLLPLIKHAAQNKVNGFTPRVVILSSTAAQFGKVDYTYLQNTDEIPFMFNRYANSKLMNVMFAKKLGENLKGDGIVSHAVHPGFVDSGMTSSICLTTSQRY